MRKACLGCGDHYTQSQKALWALWKWMRPMERSSTHVQDLCPLSHQDKSLCPLSLVPFPFSLFLPSVPYPVLLSLCVEYLVLWGDGSCTNTNLFIHKLSQTTPIFFADSNGLITWLSSMNVINANIILQWQRLDTPAGRHHPDWPIKLNKDV